ncbi:hypothetical protein [Novosphingobium album (ex Hu et al. 2023)]|nr:hypothetical protein [Novosphingobium album (ex Hu et al. 2023)]
MNWLTHRTFAAPSCHLGDRISLGGWALGIAFGLTLWAVLFSLV